MRFFWIEDLDNANPKLETYQFCRGAGERDFQLKLHVRDDVTPVSQPKRKLSFGLRTKIEEKYLLDELLDKDIIDGVTQTY